MFQHGFDRSDQASLVRVLLPANGGIFPEISAGQHRFTIRFVRWRGVDCAPRAGQSRRTVSARDLLIARLALAQEASAASRSTIGQSASSNANSRHSATVTHLQRLPFARMSVTAIAQHAPDVEADALVGIVVSELEQCLCFEHIDAELLVELALQRSERRLAGLKLATWKLPRARERRTHGTTVDEPTPCTVADQSDDDVDDSRGTHAAS